MTIVFMLHFLVGCACAGNAGNVFPPPRVSGPDMRHGTCVTRVLWCMPGSLASGFLWSRWRGKRSRYSRLTRNPQFYVSSKDISYNACDNSTKSSIRFSIIVYIHIYIYIYIVMHMIIYTNYMYDPWMNVCIYVKRAAISKGECYKIIECFS